MDPLLKVFIDFVTIAFLLYVLAFGLWGMWDLSSQPGIEPKPLALEGEVSTTELPGKSSYFFIFIFVGFAFDVISKTITKTDVTGVPWFQVLHLSLSSILNLGGMMIQL